MIATFDDVNNLSYDENLIKETDKNIEKFESMTPDKRLKYSTKLGEKIIDHNIQQYFREEKLKKLNKLSRDRNDSKINGTIYTLAHLVACGLVGAGVAEGLYGWNADTIKCLETTFGATLPMGLTTSMLDYFAYCGKPLTNKVNDIKAHILKKKIASGEKKIESEITSKTVLDRIIETEDEMEK